LLPVNQAGIQKSVGSVLQDTKRNRRLSDNLQGDEWCGD
jgi:hypothetical protein